MNYPQIQEQSPRQAGAWRSQKERQAPAWPLDGMFHVGYHQTYLCDYRLGLAFNNGESGEVDLEQELWGGNV